MSYGYNKDDLTELDKLNGKIIDYQLEFESYEDNIGVSSNEFKLVNDKTYKLWHESDDLSEDKKIDFAKEILNDYENMLNNLPDKDRKRFTFDKDGKIDYEWDMSLNNRGKEGYK